MTGAERRDGKWLVSGLRDPLAAPPETLLAQARLDPTRVAGRWEPYQALHPAIMLKRLQATLESAGDGDPVAGRGRHPRHRQRPAALDGQGAGLHR